MKGLKTLMVVAFSVAATMAVAASVASAAEYKGELATTFLSGEQTSTNVFTTNGGTVKCKKAVFTGQAKEETAGSKSTKMVTIKPTYSECTAFGLAATVNMMGCEYTFTEPTATAETGWHAVVHIICSEPAPGPGPITVEVPGGPCKVEVGAQSPGGVVHIMTGAGTGTERDLDFDAAVTGIKYTSSGGACGASGENGTYTGKVTEKGFTTEGGGTRSGIFIG